MDPNIKEKPKSYQEMIQEGEKLKQEARMQRKSSGYFDFLPGGTQQSQQQNQNQKEKKKNNKKSSSFRLSPNQSQEEVEKQKRNSLNTNTNNNNNNSGEGGKQQQQQEGGDGTRTNSSEKQKRHHFDNEDDDENDQELTSMQRRTTGGATRRGGNNNSNRRRSVLRNNNNDASSASSLQRLGDDDESSAGSGSFDDDDDEDEDDDEIEEMPLVQLPHMEDLIPEIEDEIILSDSDEDENNNAQKKEQIVQALVSKRKAEEDDDDDGDDDLDQKKSPSSSSSAQQEKQNSAFGGAAGRDSSCSNLENNNNNNSSSATSNQFGGVGGNISTLSVVSNQTAISESGNFRPTAGGGGEDTTASSNAFNNSNSNAFNNSSGYLFNNSGGGGGGGGEEGSPELARDSSSRTLKSNHDNNKGVFGGGDVIIEDLDEDDDEAGGGGLADCCACACFGGKDKNSKKIISRQIPVCSSHATFDSTSSVAAAAAKKPKSNNNNNEGAVAETFCDNSIFTTKYSVRPWRFDFFLWKMLYEQFKRYNNIYFLIIGAVQMVPGLSPTGQYTTIMTLVVVLLFSFIKLGIEDFMRYKRDCEINERPAYVLKSFDDKDWRKLTYADIRVGDIVRVDNIQDDHGNRNNEIPCDLIVLSTSEGEGVCYVETANLDGETNLKQRRAIIDTVLPLDEGYDAATVTQTYRGMKLESEKPNGSLYTFGAKLEVPGGAERRRNIMLYGFDYEKKKREKEEKEKQEAEERKKQEEESSFGNFKDAWSPFQEEAEQRDGLFSGEDEDDEDDDHDQQDQNNNNNEQKEGEKEKEGEEKEEEEGAGGGGGGKKRRRSSKGSRKNSSTSNKTKEGEQEQEGKASGSGSIVNNNIDESSGGKYLLATSPKNDADFEAYQKDDEGARAVNLQQALYRGCSLRKAFWAVGVCVSTGHETKIMKNSRSPPHKSSRVEKMTNSLLVAVLGLQLILCVVGAIVFGVRKPEWWYLPAAPASSGDYSNTGSHSGNAAVSFLTFLILFNNFIPISLYVSIEFIKFGQGRLLEQDLTMYYPPKDMPASAKSTDLNEELGQIEFVFCDKTGTLTRNVMALLKFAVNNTVYGEGTTEIGRAAAARRGTVLEDPRPQSVIFGPDPFWDRRLGERWFLDKQVAHIRELMFSLGVCHTVVIDGKKLEAESPDDEALVKAAARFDHELVERSLEGVMLQAKNSGTTFVPVLETVHFNSVRKRMSVLIKHPHRNDEYYLIIKGADTVMLPRLKRDQPLRYTAVLLDKFAEEGLRTLVVAHRKLDPTFAQGWLMRMKDARSMVGREKARDALIDKLANEIEKDLTLVGVTGVEDKLQDRVSQTIGSLRHAGLKVWMLTGDKRETATNIGFACSLFHGDMDLVDLHQFKKNEGPKLLKEFNEGVKRRDQMLANPKAKTVSSGATGNDGGGGGGGEIEEQGCIIDGHTLALALSTRELKAAFYQLVSGCSSVICCRVSPKQKADVVQMVRDFSAVQSSDGESVTTLAIGDGANDVPMIQAAHVGVGISGMEGQQAANSADFAIGQFKYLHRLLLVHGYANYNRISVVIKYSFYKNALLVMTLFFYNIYNHFSGTSLYEQWSFAAYNVVFTFFPVVVVGIFDREILNTDRIHDHPQLYKTGAKSEHLTIPIIIYWLLVAVVQGAIIFFITMVSSDGAIGKVGQPMALDGTGGACCYCAVVIVATLQLCLMNTSFTQLHYTACGASIVALFFFLAVYGVLPSAVSTTLYGVLVNVAFEQIVWLLALFAVLVALLPTLLVSYYFKTLRAVRNLPLSSQVQLADQSNPLAAVQEPKEMQELDYLASDMEGGVNRLTDADKFRHQSLTFLLSGTSNKKDIAIDDRQDLLLRFVDGEVEEAFVDVYIGDMFRYKLGFGLCSIVSLLVCVAYVINKDATPVELAGFVLFFLASLVGFIVIYFFPDVKSQLHELMILLMLIAFSGASISNLNATIRTGNSTHPVTLAVIMLGIIVLVRPILYQAFTYQVIVIVVYFLWSLIWPPPGWSRREESIRAIEILLVSMTALIGLGVSENFYRKMFVAQLAVTQALERAKNEKRRSMLLLQNVMPSSIVADLRGKSIGQFSLSFEKASIVTSDVVSFTKFSSSRESHVVVEMLNIMFVMFDAHASELGIEKIKTIGDAFLCISGAPALDPEHSNKIVTMGLWMLRSIGLMNREGTPSIRNLDIAIRVGAACGLVRAGVVARSKLCYDVFGPALQEATELEAASKPNRLRVSPALHECTCSLFQYEIDVTSTPGETKYFAVDDKNDKKWLKKEDSVKVGDNSSSKTSNNNKRKNSKEKEGSAAGSGAGAGGGTVVKILEEGSGDEKQKQQQQQKKKRKRRRRAAFRAEDTREDQYAYLTKDKKHDAPFTAVYKLDDGEMDVCSLNFESELIEDDFRGYLTKLADSRSKPERVQAVALFALAATIMGLYLESILHWTVLSLVAVTLLVLLSFFLRWEELTEFEAEVARTGGLHDILNQKSPAELEVEAKKAAAAAGSASGLGRTGSGAGLLREDSLNSSFRRRNRSGSTTNKRASVTSKTSGGGGGEGVVKGGYSDVNDVYGETMRQDFVQQVDAQLANSHSKNPTPSQSTNPSRSQSKNPSPESKNLGRSSRKSSVSFSQPQSRSHSQVATPETNNLVVVPRNKEKDKEEEKEKKEEGDDENEELEKSTTTPPPPRSIFGRRRSTLPGRESALMHVPRSSSSDDDNNKEKKGKEGQEETEQESEEKMKKRLERRKSRNEEKFKMLDDIPITQSTGPSPVASPGENERLVRGRRRPSATSASATSKTVLNESSLANSHIQHVSAQDLVKQQKNSSETVTGAAGAGGGGGSFLSSTGGGESRTESEGAISPTNRYLLAHRKRQQSLKPGEGKKNNNNSSINKRGSFGEGDDLDHSFRKGDDEELAVKKSGKEGGGGGGGANNSGGRRRSNSGGTGGASAEQLRLEHVALEARHQQQEREAREEAANSKCCCVCCYVTGSTNNNIKNSSCCALHPFLLFLSVSIGLLGLAIPIIFVAAIGPSTTTVAAETSTVSVFLCLAAIVNVVGSVRLRLWIKIIVALVHGGIFIGLFMRLSLTDGFSAGSDGGNLIAIVLTYVLSVYSGYQTEASVRENFSTAMRVEIENRQVQNAVTMCDRLLTNVLPANIINRMRNDPSKRIVDEVDDASILFLYIDGIKPDDVNANASASYSMLEASALAASGKSRSSNSKGSPQLQQQEQQQQPGLLELANIDDDENENNNNNNNNNENQSGGGGADFGNSNNMMMFQPSVAEFAPSPRIDSTVKKFASTQQLIHEMNDFVFMVDILCQYHRVEKIKTVPFLVAAGCPDPCPLHYVRLACLARDVILLAERSYQKTGRKVTIKAGLHSGRVSAGVLGSIKFIYDVFGDTVNFSSRLASKAADNSVSCSQAVADRLRPFAEMVDDGEIELKGKGNQQRFHCVLDSLDVPIPPFVQPLLSPEEIKEKIKEKIAEADAAGVGMEIDEEEIEAELLHLEKLKKMSSAKAAEFVESSGDPHQALLESDEASQALQNETASVKVNRLQGRNMSIVQSTSAILDRRRASLQSTPTSDSLKAGRFSSFRKVAGAGSSPVHDDLDNVLMNNPSSANATAAATAAAGGTVTGGGGGANQQQGSSTGQQQQEGGGGDNSNNNLQPSPSTTTTTSSSAKKRFVNASTAYSRLVQGVIGSKENKNR